MRRIYRSISFFAMGVVSMACSSQDTPRTRGTTERTTVGGDDDAGLAPSPPPSTPSDPNPASTDAGGFTIDEDAATSPDAAIVTRDPNCGTVMAIIRDFTPDTNPDFEMDIDYNTYPNLMGAPGLKGIVKPQLENGYPAYAPSGATGMTHGPQQFYQWYVDTPNVNIRLRTQLVLTETTPGRYVYDSTAFFPIDGQGFGNYKNTGHNFHFTTEIRTTFTYRGGEVLMFRGDDDMWLFVNGILAIDLGGLHAPLEGMVDMDQFAGQHGLTKGQAYSMDIFHAERHTTGSNFHVETTIDCLTVVEPPPPPPPPK